MYIELFLLDNALMNSLILRTAAAMLSRRLPCWRMIAASVLGAIYAALSVGTVPLLMSLPMKLVLGLLMALAIPFKTAKEYMFSALALFVSTFAVGGAAVGLAFLLGGKLENGFLLAAVPLRVMLGSALLASFMPRVIRRVLERRLVNNSRLRIEIIHKGVSICASAIVDTGNMLCEPMSGLPVVVISSRELECFATIPIPCRTVSGNEVVYGFRPDKLQLSGKMNAVLDVFVAIGSVSIEGADALIPPSALPDLGHSNTADV